MVVLVLVVVCAAVMAAVERARPGRALPQAPGFGARSVLLNGMHGLLVVGGGLWLQPWLESVRPWSADGLGLVGGAVFGYLVVTFVYYWWHRARHEVPWLWRALHQVHHSPSRLELHTSFYKHPLEAATNVVFGGFLLYVLCGLDPAVAQWTVLVNCVAEFFYHWNVRTPRWMGWILQRPESHCRHHEAGAACNYADLPLWDWLFGTLDNPATQDFVCGHPDEERLADMLFGVDLDAPAGVVPSPRRFKLAAVGLVAVGTLAIVGDVSGQPVLLGLGLASGASPAPKVFTSRDGLESFSATYEVRWEAPDGTHSVTLSPQAYARLAGPYNRRNVYGAALAGGPVMAHDPVLRPMLEEVVRNAFCADLDVLAELGIQAEDRISVLEVRVHPLPGHPAPQVPLSLWLPC